MTMTPEERAAKLVADHNDYRKPWVCGGGHGESPIGLDTHRVETDIAAAIREAVEAERMSTTAKQTSAEDRIRIANKTGEIRFSSGHNMNPEGGYVGLNHKFEIGEGQDNSANIWGADGTMTDPMWAKDLAELADIVIDRWQRFKASLEEK